MASSGTDKAGKATRVEAWVVLWLLTWMSLYAPWAGGDLRLIASRVTAESGRIGLIAGGDLELDGRWQTRSDTRQEEESWRIDAPIEAGGDIWSPPPEARQLAGGGTRTQEARQERAWQGTEIQGQSVLIHAGGDLTATGGRIEGRDGVTLTVRPDLVGDKIIIEVKDVINLSNSNQLRGIVQMALETERPFELVISPRNNHMSQPLWDLIEREGGSVTQFNPATGRFTTVTSKPTLPR